MRRPVAVLLPILVLLLAFGVPFLGEPAAFPARTSCPRPSRPAQAWDTIETKFPAGETAPIDMLVDRRRATRSRPRTRPRWRTTRRGWRHRRRGGVNGPFSLTEPAGQPLGRRPPRRPLARPARGPRPLNGLIAADVRGSTVHLQVVSPLAGTPAGQTLVQTIRATEPRARNGRSWSAARTPPLSTSSTPRTRSCPARWRSSWSPWP